MENQLFMIDQIPAVLYGGSLVSYAGAIGGIESMDSCVYGSEVLNEVVATEEFLEE